jgi:4-hydroxy-2-oxoglutarate aldolase
MQRVLGGMMAPLVSPFDATTGDLVRARFERQIRYYFETGLSGVLVAGSSGEAALLDEDERTRLIGWARECVPTDRWLIAGVGAESTRATVRRAREAATAGADAVLVVAPHYFLKRMNDASLIAHFQRVADDSPLPVMLYNVPAYAHLVLSPTLVATLATHGNVIGMKDSAGNLPVLGEYLAAQSPTFRVLTGSGQTTREAMAAGASGAILAVALFAAPLVAALETAVRDGEQAEAETLQFRLTRLARIIVAELGPPGLKAAMDLVGLEGGAPRSPLRALDAAERERVAVLLGECAVPPSHAARSTPSSTLSAAAPRIPA